LKNFENRLACLGIKGQKSRWGTGSPPTLGATTVEEGEGGHGWVHLHKAVPYFYRPGRKSRGEEARILMKRVHAASKIFGGGVPFKIVGGKNEDV